MTPLPPVEVWAPGKLVLLGEYAVLAGHPAIVMAVDRYVRLFPGAENARSTGLIGAARAAAAHALGVTLSGVGYEANSAALAYEGKLGLGSSAAVAAAAAASVFHETGRDIEDREVRTQIWQIAAEVHRQAQAGLGRGVDVAAALFGGHVLMRPGTNGREPTFTPLAAPKALEWVYLWTGSPASTPKLVAEVERWRARHADDFARITARMGALVERAHDEFTLEIIESFAALLVELGEASGAPIVTPVIRAAMELAHEHGGALKPSGAGGGDILLAAFPSGTDHAGFLRGSKALGLTPLPLATAERGVHVRPLSRASARLPGWDRRSIQERRKALWAHLRISRRSEIASMETTLDEGGLDIETADRLVEGVVGRFVLPFAVAPNFLVNGREILVPMVTEEPSVVAAATNAARMARAGGGFRAEADAPLMVCQIQLFAREAAAATERVAAHREELLAVAAEVGPNLQAAGGGPRDLTVRAVSDEAGAYAFLVVELVVDVRDAMGANIVNTMGERVAPHLARVTGERVGLTILSNLADRRRVHARVTISAESLALQGFSGEQVCDGIVAAARFAELDAYRAATHNKGIMNGVDAVLLATGNDGRAVSAGAHAFAARTGRYLPLSTWRRTTTQVGGGIEGQLTMPMAVGTVGGATRIHPSARLALQIAGVETAQELAEVVAAVGLASNLAALRALSTEGIQRGHMQLHHRKR